MGRKTQLFVFIAVIFLIGFGIAKIFSVRESNRNVVDPNHTEDTIAEKVASCNVEKVERKFSCYRALLDGIYKGQPIEEFVRAIEQDSSISFKKRADPIGVFGTNCHNFYHALGDFIASESQDHVNLEEFFELCPSTCTGGCYMAAFKRNVMNQDYSSESIQKNLTACTKLSPYACSHEYGHLLHDSATQPVMQIVDEISSKSFGLSYVNGNSYEVLDKIGADELFTSCSNLENGLGGICNTGIGHNMFLLIDYSQNGLSQAVSECSDYFTKSLDISECKRQIIYRTGINKVASLYLSGEFEAGFEKCSEVVALTGEPDLLEYCFYSLGRGLGWLFISENPHFAGDGGKYEIEKNFIISLCENIPIINFQTACVDELSRWIYQN